MCSRQIYSLQLPHLSPKNSWSDMYHACNINKHTNDSEDMIICCRQKKLFKREHYLSREKGNEVHFVCSFFMMRNVLYREMTSISSDLFWLDDYDKTRTPPIIQTYFSEMSCLLLNFHKFNWIVMHAGKYENQSCYSSFMFAICHH